MAGKKGVRNPHNDRQRTESVARAQLAYKAILDRPVAVVGPAAWHRAQHLRVLKARLRNPTWSLREVAEANDMTKDKFAGALARAIKYGERIGEGKDR